MLAVQVDLVWMVNYHKNAMVFSKVREHDALRSVRTAVVTLSLMITSRVHVRILAKHMEHSKYILVYDLVIKLAGS